jgi:hypothetical protein
MFIDPYFIIQASSCYVIIILLLLLCMKISLLLSFSSIGSPKATVCRKLRSNPHKDSQSESDIRVKESLKNFLTIRVIKVLEVHLYYGKKVNNWK